MDKQTVTIDEAIAMVVRLRKDGQIRRAAQVCQRVLLADPVNPDANFHLGAIRLQVGAAEEAASCLQLALQARPGSPVCAYMLGAAQEMASQIDSAIASFRKALTLDVSFAAAHFGLASSLCRLEKLDDARVACERAIELDRDNPEYAHFMAQILQRCGKHDEAEVHHRRALEAGEDVRRCQIIQAALAARRANVYVEIGVDTGHNLKLVWAPVKLAIDPVDAAPLVKAQVNGRLAKYFQMTSDQFFAENGELLAERPVDVAFIDGLHTYEQTLVDVENCLRYLAEGGVILLHDCNPTTESMAIPAASYEDACQQRQPGDNSDWTGDVWKAIVKLRVERDDLTTAVLNCDYGVGVVVKRPSEQRLKLGDRTVDELNYADLEANRDDFLGLRPPSDLWAVTQTT